MTFLYDRKNLRNKAELIIGISNWCNYDCSYCMPHSKSRTSRLDNRDAIIKIIHDSYQHFKNYAEVSQYGVLFVGGEPTIHPDFNYIIDNIQSIKQQEPEYKITIVSNMSRTIRWLESISPKVTGFIASYHDEFTTAEEFANKVIRCLSKNDKLIVTVGIQPLPGRLEKLQKDCYYIRDSVTRELGEDVASNRLDFIIQHLYTGIDTLFPYTEHDFAMFKVLINEFNNPNIVIEQKLGEQEDFLDHSFADSDEFYQSKCYAGIEGLTVAFNGNLQRTSRCRLGNNQKDLGNIYTEYTLPTEPAICDVKKGCGNCWFDYSYRKTK